MQKAAFFIAEKWEEASVENSPLAKELALSFYRQPLTVDSLPDEAKEVALVSVFVDSRIDREVIEALPNLKLISTRSTGYDHIDLEAARQRNITVVNVPSYGANTVAEHAFALLLSLSKRIFDGYEQVREEGNFDPHALRGFDLHGKTLGVIGTGHIGRHAVHIGRGFGMQILACDAKPDESFARETGCSYLSLEELLASSDVVTVHVPYLESTHHLLNAQNMRRMKRGSVLINTSRGPVVETRGIIEALDAGILRGAGLDVLEEEGVIKDEMHFLAHGRTEGHDLKVMLMNHVLIDRPNVIITPHSAFNTQEALARIMETTLHNIARFLEGEPVHVVGQAS